MADIEEGRPVPTAAAYGGLSPQMMSDLMESRTNEDLEQLGGVRGIAEKLKSNITHGLTGMPDELGDRAALYGENVFAEIAPKTFFSLFVEALKDPMLIVLAILAVISLGLGMATEGVHEGWYEGVAILAAVLLVSFVTALNEYNKDKQFRNLDQQKNDRLVKCIRGGLESQISIYDLVVGDVVALHTGDFIPADGLFLTGFDVACDEAALTGESDTMRKRQDKPFFLSGCQVVEGSCTMMITAVGKYSTWGVIKEALANKDEEAPETHLQAKLSWMATFIGKIGVAAALITFTVLTIRWIVAISNDGFEASDLNELVEYAVVAITIIVVAVPEGLPLAVTISLAYSMSKMMDDNNLVRHLEAAETMGNASAICSDKTGTLTTNRMKVVAGWFAGKYYDEPPTAPGVLSRSVASSLIDGIAINSTAHVNPATGDKPVEYIGSKTECALLGLCSELGVPYGPLRSSLGTKVLHMYSFSSKKKRMGCLLDYRESSRAASNSKAGTADVSEDTAFRYYVKGASEIVLGLCSKMVRHDGSVSTLGDSMRVNIQENIDDMARSGLRTLTLAYKDVPMAAEGTLEQWEEEGQEEDLVVIAVIGIQDPVRPEVPDAVASCVRAGITVRMVTGDNILTANTIATQCGILTEAGTSIEGPTLRKLSDEDLDGILPTLQVIARCSPTDKERLVRRLIHLGEVVGVTGDGTNDAPALKAADVGLAMGISGTDVAKDAADIIILDDCFASIVKSILWGRSVYDNVRCFLQFQLTVNVVALAVAVIAAVGGQGTPLKTIQLLWVNLIMDTLAALALGTGKPHPSLLHRRPFGRREPLIDRVMARNIGGQSIFQLIVLMVFVFAGLSLFGLEENDAGELVKNTIVFNTFVFMQIFNEINSRKVGHELNVFAGILDNYIFLTVLVVTVVSQVILVEFGGSALETTGLTGMQWFWCVFIGFLSLPLGLIIRLWRIDGPWPASVLARINGAVSALRLEGDPVNVDDSEENEKKSSGKEAPLSLPATHRSHHTAVEHMVSMDTNAKSTSPPSSPPQPHQRSSPPLLANLESSGNMSPRSSQPLAHLGNDGFPSPSGGGDAPQLPGSIIVDDASGSGPESSPRVGVSPIPAIG